MLRTISAALALMALSACSQPKDLVVHGELSYDTQIILPPDATAHVEVRAKPDEFSPAIAIGSVDAPAPGSPIPFTVTVPGKAIPKDVTSFTVVGQIKHGDRYFFITGDQNKVTMETAAQPVNLHLVYSPPASVAYKCGKEWFNVAFDTDAAMVTAENQMKPTRAPLVQPGPGDGKRLFKTPLFSFVQDGKTVLFAYGNDTPQPCILGKG